MIYFDNAATSFPKPNSVIKEVVRCLNTYCGNSGRSSHSLAMLASEKIYEARCKTADFLGANKAENVIFTYNATYALNFAIKNEIEEGDHILISDMEHNSVLRPVYKLKSEKKCDFDVFSTDGDIIKNLSSLKRKNTKLLICNHVSNVSGRILPVEEIGAFCKKHKIRFILDASQSAGHIVTDIKRIGCDILCAPAHKGLFGIQGCGIIIFEKVKEIKEFIVGGSGTNSLSPHMPENLPERLEAGTLSTPALASLVAGIDFINSVGISSIEERERVLRKLLFERLSSIKNLSICDENKNCSSVISFSLKDAKSESVGAYLDSCGICVRSGLHCAPLAHKTLNTTEDGTVRVSLGYFNTVNEIDTFYKKMKEFKI